MSIPEAGQWWFPNKVKHDGRSADDCGVFIVGRNSDGRVVYQYDKLGHIETDASGFHGWHHEPRCSNWDWVVPEEPPATPSSTEDPDEWVVQDRVHMRPGVDETRWVRTTPGERWAGDWTLFDGFSVSYMHGSRQMNDKHYMIEVRCRRRDLPKAEQSSLGHRVEQTLTPEWIQQAAKSENGCPVGAGASKVEQPEQWPKYWTTCDATEFAYVEQIDEASAKYVRKDGSHIVAQWGMAELRKQLTEAEAMAMIKKPEPKPAKTRVRLFMPTVLNSSNRHNEVVVRDDPGNPNLWQEIHHDAEGFYVEESK